MYVNPIYFQLWNIHIKSAPLQNFLITFQLLILFVLLTKTEL